ncbi:hypothetical protein E2562_026214 [Oryza meyeriana var. granulata]|uniref:Uncharacterized protein n=1 Tax=Oryza meyeriana var. granulata TaxID=110450 RepID=A0A6G1E4H9_9ORYZ|nr:hypothetical protein E2562_026214 [Oryza meyeriana var. granulata]
MSFLVLHPVLAHQLAVAQPSTSLHVPHPAYIASARTLHPLAGLPCPHGPVATACSTTHPLARIAQSPARLGCTLLSLIGGARTHLSEPSSSSNRRPRSPDAHYSAKSAALFPLPQSNWGGDRSSPPPPPHPLPSPPP